MEKLPKIARERLRQSGPAEPHPDANLISALLEGTLTPRERALVLEHLSQCADCRAVAGMALPELAQVPPVRDEQRRWMRWTVVRWGTLAASAVIIAVAVLVLRPTEWRSNTPSSPTVSDNSPLSQPPPAPEAKRAEEPSAGLIKPDDLARSAKEKGALGKLAPEKKDYSLASQQRRDEAKVQFAAPASPQNVARSNVSQRVGGPSQANVQNQFIAQQNQNVAVPAAAPAPPPPPTQAVIAGNEAATPARSAAVDADKTAAPAKLKDAPAGPMAKAAPPPVPSAAETVEVTSAAPPVETGASKQELPVQTSGVTASRAQSALRRAVADGSSVRWAIGDRGRVTRSVDGGRTWSDVAVAKRVVFRALSALGADVWAGGAGGALYHSSDAGEHWTRVRPTSNGTELAADVVRIEFTDLQHGTLTTADGTHWVTSDGGQNWSILSH